MKVRYSSQEKRVHGRPESGCLYAALDSASTCFGVRVVKMKSSLMCATGFGKSRKGIV